MDKIAYFHHYFAKGGSAISLSMLIKNLDRQRFNPIVVLTQEGPSREIFESINVSVQCLPTRCIWDRPWYSLSWFLNQTWKAYKPDPTITKWLEHEKPDIVHLNDTPLLPVALSASMLKIPIVWHVRRILHHYPFDPQTHILLRSIEKFAGSVVAISEDEASQFTDKEKIRIVYNSVDFSKIDQFMGSGIALRKELEIDANSFVVLAVIPLTEDKGALDFIRACGMVARNCREINFKFVIVGVIPGKYKRHLLRKYTGIIGPEFIVDQINKINKKNGIERDVILTGYRQDVYRLIDMADLIIFPSHLKAAGRPVLEGSAFAKPVLVTIPKKITGIVMDGVTGLILPPHDPVKLGEGISRIAEDRDAASRMGASGRAYALEHFNAQRNIEPIYEIYKKILNGKTTN